MEDVKRTFIELENKVGQVDKIELIGKVKSEKEDKTYAILTTDEIIGEEVSIYIGHIYVKDGKDIIEIIEDEEEINYVLSLIDKVVKDDSNGGK